jgi:hypothetical protein
VSDPTIGTGSDSSAAAAPVSPIPEKTPIDSLGVTLQQPEKSLLRHWLGECKKPDPDKERTERWESMGWEVFERKALLIAAAKDLKENGINEPLKLAATDIFVEKAQRFLDSRGKRMYLVGGATAGVAILVLAVAAWFVCTYEKYSGPARDQEQFRHSKRSVFERADP